MNYRVKLKRGTTAEIIKYKAEDYEIVFDTDKKRILMWSEESNEWIDSGIESDNIDTNISKGNTRIKCIPD